MSSWFQGQRSERGYCKVIEVGAFAGGERFQGQRSERGYCKVYGLSCSNSVKCLFQGQRSERGYCKYFLYVLFLCILRFQGQRSERGYCKFPSLPKCALPHARVSGATIRERILQGIFGNIRIRYKVVVSGATIRERILQDTFLLIMRVMP